MNCVPGYSPSMTVRTLALGGIAWNTMIYVNDFPEPRPQSFFSKTAGAHAPGDKFAGVNHSPGKVGIEHGWVANQDGDATVNDGQWHHFVWTQQKDASGSSERWTLYVDGVKDHTNTTYANTYPDSQIADSTFRIGFNPGGYFGNFWKGLIDELYIYDRTLSTTEAAAKRSAPASDRSCRFEPAE